MEISGAVLRRIPAVSGVLALRDSGSNAPAGPSTAGLGRRVSVAGRRGGRGVFSDVGHLNYYASPVRCGAGRSKKEEKKRAKLVKGLSRDLASLCTVGFDANADEGLAGEVKGKMISEAAELLLAELKQLRAREKEMKRKRKEEKATMKAARMRDCGNEESSSTSSSESSDGECDFKVVRMSNLRTPAVQEPNSEILPMPAAAPEYNPQPPTMKPRTGEGAEHHIAPKPAQGCCSTSNRSSVSLGGCCSSSSTPVVEKPMSKIEVCMGGKCKRSGALELMEEFNKKIGFEGAVVGCKCMGKCRDGPNVRVLNQGDGDVVAASVPKNPLCIGVGLDDVGTIVANFFGEKDLGLMAA